MSRLRVRPSLVFLLLGSVGVAVAVFGDRGGEPAPPVGPDPPGAPEPLNNIDANISTPAEILRAYRALGLPLPPASARLVRLTVFADRPVLAFELEPGSKTTAPRLLCGTAEGAQIVWIRRPREVAPDADAARGIDLTPDERLALVAQCQSRGWDALAGEILTHRFSTDATGTRRQQLLDLAWRHWESRLSSPTADRRPAAAGLKAMIGRDRARDTPENRALLASLDLALVPVTVKAGTVDALIEALADQWTEPYRPEHTSDAPFWLLADRGFDAVPAVVAALDDDRLTRAPLRRHDGSVAGWMRVRHVASDLLEGFATERLPRGGEGHAVTRTAAEAWWAKARAVGEEAYLVARVVPTTHSLVNLVPLRAVATKYPHRLPELYRAVLAGPAGVESEQLAAALARSAVPAREKIELLTAGAAHAEHAHRGPAVAALKALDAKRFDELVLAECEALPADAGDRSLPNVHPRVAVVQLALQSDNPRVWDALAAAARRSVVDQRGSLLFSPSGRPLPANRGEYVRLMAGFLDDAAVFGHNRPVLHDFSWWCDEIEVRNLAAYYLTWPLGIEFERRRGVTPAEWAKVRDEVRAAARRELDRSK